MLPSIICPTLSPFHLDPNPFSKESDEENDSSQLNLIPDKIFKDLASKGVINSHGEIDAKYVGLLPSCLKPKQEELLNNLLTSQIVLKSKNDSFKVSFSLKELFDFININHLRVIGGAVYSILGSEIMKDLSSLLEINEKHLDQDHLSKFDRMTKDIDLKIPVKESPDLFLSKALAFIRSKIHKDDLQKIKSQFSPEILKNDSKILKEIHKKFIKNISDSPFQANGDNWSQLCIQDENGIKYDITFVKKIERNHLFIHDSIGIEVHLTTPSYLISSKITALETVLLHKYLERLNAIDSNEINSKGALMLFCYLTKGWRYQSINLEEILVSKIIKTNRPNDFFKTVESHFENYREALPLFLFNSYYILQKYHLEIATDLMRTLLKKVPTNEEPSNPLFNSFIRCLLRLTEDDISTEKFQAFFSVIADCLKMRAKIENLTKNGFIKVDPTIVKDLKHLQISFQGLEHLKLLIEDDLEEKQHFVVDLISSFHDKDLEILKLLIDQLFLEATEGIELQESVIFSKIGYPLIESTHPNIKIFGFYFLLIHSFAEKSEKHVFLFLENYLYLIRNSPIESLKLLHLLLIKYFSSLKNENFRNISRTLSQIEKFLINNKVTEEKILREFTNQLSNIKDERILNFIDRITSQNSFAFDFETELKLGRKLLESFPNHGFKEINKALKKESSPLTSQKLTEISKDWISKEVVSGENKLKFLELLYEHELKKQSLKIDLLLTFFKLLIICDTKICVLKKTPIFFKIVSHTFKELLNIKGAIKKNQILLIESNIKIITEPFLSSTHENSFEHLSTYLRIIQKLDISNAELIDLFPLIFSKIFDDPEHLFTEDTLEILIKKGLVTDYLKKRQNNIEILLEIQNLYDFIIHQAIKSSKIKKAIYFLESYLELMALKKDFRPKFEDLFNVIYQKIFETEDKSLIASFFRLIEKQRQIIPSSLNISHLQIQLSSIDRYDIDNKLHVLKMLLTLRAHSNQFSNEIEELYASVIKDKSLKHSHLSDIFSLIDNLNQHLFDVVPLIEKIVDSKNPSLIQNCYLKFKNNDFTKGHITLIKALAPIPKYISLDLIENYEIYFQQISKTSENSLKEDFVHISLNHILNIKDPNLLQKTEKATIFLMKKLPIPSSLPPEVLIQLDFMILKKLTGNLEPEVQKFLWPKFESLSFVANNEEEITVLKNFILSKVESFNTNPELFQQVQFHVSSGVENLSSKLKLTDIHEISNRAVQNKSKELNTIASYLYNHFIEKNKDHLEIYLNELSNHLRPLIEDSIRFNYLKYIVNFIETPVFDHIEKILLYEIYAELLFKQLSHESKLSEIIYALDIYFIVFQSVDETDVSLKSNLPKAIQNLLRILLIHNEKKIYHDKIGAFTKYIASKIAPRPKNEFMYPNVDDKLLETLKNVDDELSQTLKNVADELSQTLKAELFELLEEELKDDENFINSTPVLSSEKEFDILTNKLRYFLLNLTDCISFTLENTKQIKNPIFKQVIYFNIIYFKTLINLFKERENSIRFKYNSKDMEAFYQEKKLFIKTMWNFCKSTSRLDLIDFWKLHFLFKWEVFNIIMISNFCKEILDDPEVYLPYFSILVFIDPEEMTLLIANKQDLSKIRIIQTIKDLYKSDNPKDSLYLTNYFFERNKKMLLDPKNYHISKRKKKSTNALEITIDDVIQFQNNLHKLIKNNFKELNNEEHPEKILLDELEMNFSKYLNPKFQK